MKKVYLVWSDCNEFKIFSTKKKAEDHNLKEAKKGYRSMGLSYRKKYSLQEYMVISGFEVIEKELK